MFRRQRSANGTLPHFAKGCAVNRANNPPKRSRGRPSRKNGVPKNFYICAVFWRLRDLMANICWMKRDIDNRVRALESTKGFLRVAKFHELWSTNGLKPDWSFYPPSLFRFVPVHRTPSMASHSDCRWNGIGFVCSSGLNTQKMLSWKCYRVGRPLWQYVAIIATFSSLYFIVAKYM